MNGRGRYGAEIACRGEEYFASITTCRRASRLNVRIILMALIADGVNLSHSFEARQVIVEPAAD